MKTVTCYFDVISPYAWLAWTQLEGITARTGVHFSLEPVVFGALLQATENVGPAEIPVKRRYTFQDVARWAERYRRRYEGPPAHPFLSLKALRLCVAVEDTAARNRLAGALFVACWEEGRDLTDGETLRAIAAGAGLDGAALLAATETATVKDALRASTERAVQAGAFGVPTFVVGTELFWGNDRLDFLEERLRGKKSGVDEAHLRLALARPAAVTRKR